MKAKARLIALEKARDRRCEACFDALVDAMGDVFTALLHRDVPEDVAWRYFMQTPPLTADEQTVMEVALAHVQDRMAIVDRYTEQFDAMWPRCQDWFEHRADVGDETRRLWNSKTWPEGEVFTLDGLIAPASSDG